MAQGRNPGGFETGLLVLGLAAFLVATGLLLAGLAGALPMMTGTALVALLAAVLCLAWAAWRVHTRVDWERIGAEQRLWQSGPLGRAWLRIRQRLMGRERH